MSEQDFWNDNDKAQKTLQENKNLKSTVDEFNYLQSSLDDIEVLIELALEENDSSLEKESILL